MCVWLVSWCAPSPRLLVFFRPCLLYRAAGTGKTTLARIVASKCRANFVSVTIPSILRGSVGDSEKALADVFRLARVCRCVPGDGARGCEPVQLHVLLTLELLPAHNC
jgi:hypothetical protein